MVTVDAQDAEAVELRTEIVLFSNILPPLILTR